MQPYVTDFKIGFTNGEKLVTQPVYDDFSKVKNYLIVTKNGKQGVLDGKTGVEVISPVWDTVEIPEQDNIAIVRKGTSVQYYELTKQQLSKLTFTSAESVAFSAERPTVILLNGQQSMLIDTKGAVLIQPFAGTLNVADILDKNGDLKRYLITTSNKLSLLDPVTLTARFSVPDVKLRNQTNYSVPYLEVVRSGKVGLLNTDDAFVLEPVYQSVEMLNNGFVKFRSDKGVGLWKDGKIVAEPSYLDVGLLDDRSESFFTVEADWVTYHTLGSNTSFSLGKGADYLGDGCVLGKDMASGLYGVKTLTGEVLVPFANRAAERGMGIVLTREDGKRGILERKDNKLAEPGQWFDAVEYLAGSNGFYQLKDGNKTGLFSTQAGCSSRSTEAGTSIQAI